MATSREQEWEIAEPRAEATIESVRSSSYSPETAIVDLVDNVDMGRHPRTPANRNEAARRCSESAALTLPRGISHDEKRLERDVGGRSQAMGHPPRGVLRWH